MERARPTLCVLLLAFTACGYRFVTPNSQYPEGIRSVRVPVFTNRTAEPNLEAHFTEALRAHVQRAGRLGGESADGQIDGVVLSISSAPFVGALGALPNFKVAASVQLTLTKDGRQVTQLVVAGDEDYASGPDVLTTEANRATALRRLADTLMLEGAQRLASGW